MQGKPATTDHPLSRVDNTEAMRNLATRNIRHMAALIEDVLDVLGDGDSVSAVEYLEVVRDSLDVELPRLKALHSTR